MALRVSVLTHFLDVNPGSGTTPLENTLNRKDIRYIGYLKFWKSSLTFPRGLQEISKRFPSSFHGSFKTRSIRAEPAPVRFLIGGAPPRDARLDVTTVARHFNGQARQADLSKTHGCAADS
jgi:hypothetical protein